MREILATEMLEALGVETSKSFSLIETGEALMRGDEPSPTRSSVLVRLSHSHIRIGTFQRLAYHGDNRAMEDLLRYSVEHYFPQLRENDASTLAVSFLREVQARVARMGAQWMVAGFVHGVLNTDNINITGESFDYGPWRFVPHFDPKFTAAYFDETGLYAFGRQPETLLWNLTRLAECLLPLSEQSKLEDVLGEFERIIQKEFAAQILRRLGLKSISHEADTKLASSVVQFLIKTRAPFEQFFFDWYCGLHSQKRAAQSANATFYSGEEFEPVFAALSQFEAVGNLDHAYFGRAVPCTMLIDEVEALWAPIAERDDWSAFHEKLREIAEMREAYLS
jgi:uncharacterized protein YdiU (UPF0061 family)